MSEVTLTAESGRTTGTPASRRARLVNSVPGVVYGAGQPAISISIQRSDLRRAMTTDAGSNALVSLTVDGNSTDQVLVREIQRHPVRRDVTHIDFMRIDPTKPVELEVPIILVGEAKQVTVNGGMTEQRLNKLKVRVRPDAIRNSIEVDISMMQLDRSLLVKDLVLPEGTVCLSKAQQAVVTAELTRAAVVAKPAGEEAEEAAAVAAATD